MDWSNGGMIWRMIVAIVMIVAISLLLAYAKMSQDAALALYGVIAGFFFGQYVPLKTS